MLSTSLYLALGLLLLSTRTAKADIVGSNSNFRHSGFANEGGAVGIADFIKPDGKAAFFLVVKQGRIVLFENPDENNAKRTVLNLQGQTCSNFERGMLSAEVHPQFSTNRSKRFIYIYYSRDERGGCRESFTSGPSDRVSRFNVRDDYTIDASSELVFFKTPPQGMSIHNGGDLKFGKDGYLYVTVGDGGTRPNTESQDLKTLLGKLLRFDENGGIPGSNPYAGGASCKQTGRGSRNCREIFSYGLRNPFRMAANPNTAKTLFWIADVGRGTWEEINEAGDGYKGVNYGWMIREGPCAFGSLTARCDLQRDVIDQGLTDPEHFYNHRVRNDGGGAAIGGDWPPAGAWPLPTESYIHADYVFGEIYLLDKEPSGGCRDCRPPTSSWRNTTFFTLTNGDRPVTLR